MEKPIRSTIIAFLLLNVNFNMITFGNLMIMISKGVALKIAAVIYNISVLGQWFVHTGLSDEEANPGSIIQIIISICIIALAFIFGTSNINKRDLK
jgi:hypothetical protein